MMQLVHAQYQQLWTVLGALHKFFILHLVFINVVPNAIHIAFNPNISAVMDVTAVGYITQFGITNRGEPTKFPNRLLGIP